MAKSVLLAGESLKRGEAGIAAPDKGCWIDLGDSLAAWRPDPNYDFVAYWKVDFSNLPVDQRPISALLQPDGNLVLKDAAGVLRWHSGTWGDFSNPKLVMRDGGNLVIEDSNGQTIWASGDFVGNGAVGARGYVSMATTQDLVAASGRMPAIITGSTNLGAPTQSSLDVAGVAYQLTEQRRRVVNDVVDHAFLDDLGKMGIWPGQVIQGRPLLSGDIAPIGPLARAPGAIEITTDLIGGVPKKMSGPVADPTAGAVNQLRRDLLEAAAPKDSPGLLKLEIEKASTLREVGVKLGLSVKGSAFGVDVDATLDATHRRSTVVASIRQVFYTVTFTPQGAQAGGIWQAGVTPAQLAPYVGMGNPPLFVDSIQFGRFICLTVQGAYDSEVITAALKLHWEASISGTGYANLEKKEVLESSQVKIYTLGVPGAGHFQNLNDPVADLGKVYTSGLSLSLANPGAPVSFTTRHILDNTMAHVGLAASYTQPLSAVGADVNDAVYEVWDGPGGGLVNTDILVNPGDSLKISADGQIWSGVFASGTHGPEGWVGHTADAYAPQPAGTAYCLVYRLGTSPWVEAGRFWEGTAEAGQAGTLQFNVNDNNPYNGDAQKRWTVVVDVKRAGAAAAGIYV
jgi:hypothetical protein